MKYKPDWEDAKKRLTALWNHELTDRPCIAVRAPSGKAVEQPGSPADNETKWMDPEWISATAIARLKSTWWGGEAIPSYLLMGGWVLCLGGTPRFEPGTIWFETVDVDFSEPSPFRYGNDNEWVEKHALLYDAISDLANKDDFLIGSPCILPANDVLSMVMGTESFLVSLMDQPDWMHEAIILGAKEQERVRKHLCDTIRDKHEFWYGNGGWMPFWAPEPYLSTQSDVSCMLSPEMFDDFVLPELEIIGETYGNMWYHLDGGDARQHLPRLLSMPFLKVVQYVPAPNEPPNGPGHIEMYRQIQAAGKILHVAVSKENVMPLLNELDPCLLMLETQCESIAEGEELLEAAKQL